MTLNNIFSAGFTIEIEKKSTQKIIRSKEKKRKIIIE